MPKILTQAEFEQAAQKTVDHIKPPISKAEGVGDKTPAPLMPELGDIIYVFAHPEREYIKVDKMIIAGKEMKMQNGIIYTRSAEMAGHLKAYGLEYIFEREKFEEDEVNQ